jgi:hypothetical protein
MYGDIKHSHPNAKASDDPPALDGPGAGETEIDAILARLTALA